MVKMDVVIPKYNFQKFDFNVRVVFIQKELNK